MSNVNFSNHQNARSNLGIRTKDDDDDIYKNDHLAEVKKKKKKNGTFRSKK